jgi:hypothetical protein
MNSSVDSSGLIREGNLQAFFHQSLTRTARAQHLEANDATLHYLTHLLSDYAHAERLFDHTPDGLRLRPLATLYGDALQAGSVRERRLWLRRLGDLALFVAGLFAGRLSRRLTDLDYCIAMGGNAYGYLHQTADGNPRDRALREVFGELAGDFARFVELLAAVTDRSTDSGTDVLQLFERWQATGSPLLARRLRALGVAVDGLSAAH